MFLTLSLWEVMRCVYCLLRSQCWERWQRFVRWKADDPDLSVLLTERVSQVSYTRGTSHCPRLHSKCERGEAGRSLISLSFYSYFGFWPLGDELTLPDYHTFCILLFEIFTKFCCGNLKCYPIIFFFCCSDDCLLSWSDDEGLGRAVWTGERPPPSRAGADGAAWMGRGAALLLAVHPNFWRWGPREGLQGERDLLDLLLTYSGSSYEWCLLQLSYGLFI